ncbi:hypothetical protein ACQ9ZH_17010 [Pseudomonas chlororaphis]
MLDLLGMFVKEARIEVSCWGNNPGWLHYTAARCAGVREEIWNWLGLGAQMDPRNSGSLSRACLTLYFPGTALSAIATADGKALNYFISVLDMPCEQVQNCVHS